MFDPQARRVQDPPIKALQEHKDEAKADMQEVPSRIVGFLNDLSNKVVKMEKNMQTQQSMDANQRQFQHKKTLPTCGQARGTKDPNIDDGH